MCIILSVCVRVSVRAGECTDVSSAAKLFPAKYKWVVGAFQHLSITERDEDGENEGGEGGW